MSAKTTACCGPNCIERIPTGQTYCSPECEQRTGVRYALRHALAAAGYIDPDDGTVPMWPNGDEGGPVWVQAWRLCDVIIANWPERAP